MVRVLSPQEVEVFYILPAIRRELTKELKDLGKSQKQIAELLHITEPAVSQYVNQKRASEVTFGKAMLTEIQKSARKLIAKANAMAEVQRLLKLSLKERSTCKTCQNVVPQVKKGCTVCFNEKA